MIEQELSQCAGHAFVTTDYGVNEICSYDDMPT